MGCKRPRVVTQILVPLNFLALIAPLISTQYHIIHENKTYIFDKPDSINDLGVIFDSKLSFRDNISQKINKAYSILIIIIRNFIYMDETNFILLYKPVVRPHLEYANSVWCPYKMGDIKEIEKVQKKSNQTHRQSKEYVVHRQASTSKASYVKIHKTAEIYDSSF